MKLSVFYEIHIQFSTYSFSADKRYNFNFVLILIYISSMAGVTKYVQSLSSQINNTGNKYNKN